MDVIAMHEEPFRWVEAIANRREYIEDQLAPGSPIVALSYRDGVLLFTLSRERQKVFEIYDRIALGGLGHPGDIERLRLAAIEVASTEGFARSADDVSLRRLANYSLSPALKAAFEQIYGPAFLARLLFAELGRNGAPDSFVRLDYDGALRTNGGNFGKAFEHFGAIAGKAHATRQMESFLSGKDLAHAGLSEAVRVAADAWSVGHLALAGDREGDLPAKEQIASHLHEQLAAASIEAAVLEHKAAAAAAYRTLPEREIREILNAR
jgi:proteasome alpha subunit